MFLVASGKRPIELCGVKLAWVLAYARTVTEAMSARIVCYIAYYLSPTRKAGLIFNSMFFIFFK